MTLNESESTPSSVSRDLASRNPSIVYTNESNRTLEAWLSKVWESSRP